MKRFQPPAPAALACFTLAGLCSMSAGAAPADGLIDTTFGTNGRTIVGFDTLPAAPIDIVQDTVVDSLGRIYLVGVVNTNDGQRIGITRLKENGTLDTNYGPQDVGLVVAPTQLGFTFTGASAALDASGELLVGGTVKTAGNDDFAVCRFDIDGSLSAFSNGLSCVKIGFDLGSTNSDVLRDIVVQSDGKIVMAGSAFSPVVAGYYAAFARLNTNGNLDTTFNGTGKLSFLGNFGYDDTKVNAVKMTTNGKIVAVADGRVENTGYTEPLFLRLLSNGTLDSTFGLNGQSPVNISALRNARLRDLVVVPGSDPQDDESLIGAGEIESFIGSGVYDGLLFKKSSSGGGTVSSFGTAGVATDTNGAALTFNAMLREKNGNLTVVGTIRTTPTSKFNYYITRYLPNGTRDTADFNPGIGFTEVDFLQLGGSDLANAVALQGDRVIIAGTSLVSAGPPVNLDFSAVALRRDRIFAHGFE